MKGDKYAIWKLSDLSSQTAVISLFLFGKSYQEHWKTSVGTVVALLNPNIMPAKEVWLMLIVLCAPLLSPALSFSPPPFLLSLTLPLSSPSGRRQWVWVTVQLSCSLTRQSPQVNDGGRVPGLYRLPSSHKVWKEV